MSELPGVGRCGACRRTLTNPKSIQRGLGPICARKLEALNRKRREADPSADGFLPIPFEKGIVLRRQGHLIKTNVPHLVVHHSPCGFEFGYAGSGPADLALNTVEMMLNHLGYKGERTTCFQGTCFSLAYRLHQAFKVAFIASAPREGAIIPYPVAEAWVVERISG